MSKRIHLQKDPSGHYHLLKLDGLEAGNYKLKTRFCSNELQNISIQVHKGTYWKDNFILKKH